MLLYPLSRMPIVLITTDKALVLLLYCTENAIGCFSFRWNLLCSRCNNKQILPVILPERGIQASWPLPVSLDQG